MKSAYGGLSGRIPQRGIITACLLTPVAIEAGPNSQKKAVAAHSRTGIHPCELTPPRSAWIGAGSSLLASRSQDCLCVLLRITAWLFRGRWRRGSASDSAAHTLAPWINSFAPKFTEESVHPLYQNATTLLNGGVLSSREVKLGGENVIRGIINSTN